jgi:purine nucleoside permease
MELKQHAKVQEPAMGSRSSVLAAALPAAARSRPAAPDRPAIAPKVLVITMFGGEAKPWLDGEALGRKLTLPGLSKASPEVACSDDGLCMMTTGMGYGNAANSIAALVFSSKFDLAKTYFLISGIAGIDPAQGTLGSAHWARFAVDGGCKTRSTRGRRRPIGAPAICRSARRRRARKPNRYGDEVCRLNEDLLQAAFRLTKDVELVESDAAKAYRAAAQRRAFRM